MMNKDYVFHVNWEDRYKSSHRVGILAEIDKYFYFIIKDEKDAKVAYANGFIGVPGFNSEEVYRSQELFDFFKSRILESDKANPSEELAKSKGISMIDSFSVEEISGRMSERYKDIILKAYELQERKRNLQEKNNKNVDSNESHDDIE